MSLHAGVAAKVHQRQKLERVCRYIALDGRRVDGTGTGPGRLAGGDEPDPRLHGAQPGALYHRPGADLDPGHDRPKGRADRQFPEGLLLRTGGAAWDEGFSAKYSYEGQTRSDDNADAEQLHRELSPHRTGSVPRIEKKIRRNRPPLLYDVTNLQRDANRRFGLSAAQVLEYAQALYETHKLISHPRTESRHISEDMVPALPDILVGFRP